MRRSGPGQHTYRSDEGEEGGDVFDDDVSRPVHPDVDADAFLAAQNDMEAWDDEETSPDIYDGDREREPDDRSTPATVRPPQR